MFNLLPFDNKLYKIVRFTRNYVTAFCLLGIILVLFFLPKTFLSPILILVLVFLWPVVWLTNAVYSPASQFLQVNNIERYFKGTRNRWHVVRPQYNSMHKSSFMTPQDYGKYADKVWNLKLINSNVAIVFNEHNGCTAWIQLDRSFPHLVVDSLGDRHSLSRTLRTGPLPTEKIILEGDFPSSFKVLHEPNQHQLTLQILSPDRMMALVDKLKAFNLEIQDDYLRLFAANAQRSSGDFQEFINALEQLSHDFKVTRLNHIKD